MIPLNRIRCIQCNSEQGNSSEPLARADDLIVRFEEDFRKMNIEIERNLGEQPIAWIMADHGLKAHDLVAISTQQITHKMVSRACKGRKLTANVQSKIRAALNESTGKEYSMEELFTY